MTTLPTDEEQQRAKWDLLLTDIELRLEQVRQLKTYEPLRLWVQALTAFAAVFAAGGVIGGLIIHLSETPPPHG
jgi:hypothetical protein